MGFLSWLRKSPDIPVPITDGDKGIEEAKKLRRDAEKQYREVLDQQSEVWRTVHRAKYEIMRNHLGEDIQKALLRKRRAT